MEGYSRQHLIDSAHFITEMFDIKSSQITGLMLVQFVFSQRSGFLDYDSTYDMMMYIPRGEVRPELMLNWKKYLDHYYSSF